MTQLNKHKQWMLQLNSFAPDKVMTDQYDVSQFGISFNGNVRWFVAAQDKFFYCKKCWINPTKSKAASDQLYFSYSIN